MVEPLAKLVQGSISRYPALSAASKAVTSTRRNPFSASFFTPKPRQHPSWTAEGSTSSTGAAGINQCRDWSCCTVRHSLACSNRDHGWNLDFERPRKGRSARNARPATLKQQNSFKTVPYSTNQRRHASMATKTAHPPSSLPYIVQEPVNPSLELFDQSCKLETELPCSISEAWQAYEEVVDQGLLILVPSEDILYFAGNLIACVERDAQRNKGKIRADYVQGWVERIESVLTDITPTLPSQHSEYAKAVDARLKALSGDILEPKRLSEETWQMYSLLFDPATVGPRAKDVLEQLAQEGEGCLELVDCKLDDVPQPFLPIRQGIGVAAHALKDPVKAVLDIKNPPIRDIMLSIILCGFMDHKSLQRASELVREGHRHSILAPKGMVRALAMSLIKEHQYIKARYVNACSPAPEPRISLLIASADGKPEEAERIFAQHESLQSLPQDRRSLLLAYANAQDVPGVIDTFNRLYPPAPGGGRQNKPTSSQYFPILMALAKSSTEGGVMGDWISDMEACGAERDASCSAMLIQYYAKHDRTDDIVSLLNDMQQRRIRGSLEMYTTAMAHFGRRKDVITVEALYKRMLHDQIRPDTHVFVTLMNAHVEGGTWAGVIKAYKYIKSEYPDETLDVNIFNVILKSYLHAGAPFRVVRDEFWRLVQSGGKPNAYTFNIVAEGACDAREMSSAETIYRECLRRHKKNPSSGILTTHMFAIMITGYNEVQDYDRAMSTYDEMIELGFKADSFVYAAIVRGLAARHRLGGTQVAEEFVVDLLAQEPSNSWQRSPPGHSAWYEQVYAPLFHVYRKTASYEDALRLFRSIMDTGGKPTIFLLTSLLDAYRRAFFFEGVYETWDILFQMAIQQSNSASSLRDTETTSAAQNAPDSILCGALSIYMDACSRNGQHARVAEAWRDFRQHNFKADPRNWNSLMVSLVRAGEVTRAFGVLDRVVLPNQRAASNFNPVVKDGPNTPLLFDKPMLEASGPGSSLASTQLYWRSLSDNHSRRIVMARAKVPQPSVEDGCDVDLNVRPLEDILKSAPSWGTWRPHFTAMQKLLQVLTKLEQGYLTRATAPGERQAPALVKDRDVGAAHALLNRIASDFPDAFHAVMNYKQYERNRLGKRFVRIYERVSFDNPSIDQ